MCYLSFVYSLFMTSRQNKINVEKSNCKGKVSPDPESNKGLLPNYAEIDPKVVQVHTMCYQVVLCLCLPLLSLKLNTE